MRLRIGILAGTALLAAGCASATPSWSYGAPATPPAAAVAASPAVATAPPATPSPAASEPATPAPSASEVAALATPPTTAVAVTKDTATLSEFKIALASDTLAAGTDTFTVTNAGTIGHEFVIKRSSAADDALPTKADGTVDEESSELGDVGEVEIATPGETKDLAQNLAPGSYVFFCNIPGHYSGGMHGSFTVVAPAAEATPPVTADAVSHDAASLSEYKIALVSNTLAAGDDTFTVTNAGTIGHEFVIKRTTLSDAALPTKADGTVDEESSELGDVGEVEIATPGETKDLAQNLAPGSYVFFCNIPGHYSGGMHGSFTVVASAMRPGTHTGAAGPG